MANDTAFTVLTRPSWGHHNVGLAGIVTITLYLVFVSLSAFYVIVKIWPPDPLPGVVTTTAGNPPAATPESTTRQTAPIKWTVNLFWCDNDNVKRACWISLNTS